MKRRKRPYAMSGSMPAREAIAEAQVEIWRDLRFTQHGDAPEMTCWACGYWFEEPDAPERAHIIAAVHGGPNEPSNYFLLCHSCHRKQPDAADRETQLLWLRSREYYADVQTRRSMAMLDDFARQATAMGVDEDVRRRWLDALGWDGLAAIGQKARDRVACAENFDGNLVGALVENLRDFAAKQ